MSIKIYDGLRATINDPFELATEIQKVLDTVFLNSFKEAYEEAKSAFRSDPTITWDTIFHVGKEKPMCEYSIDIDLYKIVEKLQKSNKSTYSKLDFGYEITLYSNAAGGNPLVLVFGAKSKEYTDILISSGLVENYGYWDNVDVEEGVSDAEWIERELAWSDCSNEKSKSRGLIISIPDQIESCVSLYPSFS